MLNLFGLESDLQPLPNSMRKGFQFENVRHLYLKIAQFYFEIILFEFK